MLSVRLRCSVPPVFITQMSRSPTNLVNAILLPSGENSGKTSVTALLVRLVGVPEPSAFITQMSKSFVQPGSPSVHPGGSSRLLGKAIFVASGEKTGPSARSGDIFGDGQMLVVRTPECRADSLGQFVGTEHSIGLYNLALAVDPLGLYRIEPRTLLWQ